MQIGFISEERNKKPFLLSTADYIKAGNYSIAKERLSIVSTILEYGLFIFWITDGFKILSQYTNIENETLSTLLFIFGFLGVSFVVNLPIEIYQKFVIDDEFGFNKSTKTLYFIDTLKEILITVAVGSPIILALSYFIDNFELWWLYSFFAIFAFVIFVNMLYPTLIAPIFNKIEPLQNSELENEISSLLKRVGFQSSGVFKIDASKRDSRLNAYFGGFGKSKRVVLFDTLLEKLNSQELLAVLGHELGHFKNGDIYKNLAVVGTLLFLVFYTFGNIPLQFFELLEVEESASTIIPLLLMLSPLFSIFIMPIFGYISRRNEFEADKVGSELSGNPIYLREALKKLVKENRSFPKSHPIYIFFYYSHPPISERLERLEKE
jgi:STE24 endopeptidase